MILSYSCLLNPAKHEEMTLNNLLRPDTMSLKATERSEGYPWIQQFLRNSVMTQTMNNANPQDRPGNRPRYRTMGLRIPALALTVLLPASPLARADNGGNAAADAGIETMTAIQAALDDELFDLAVTLLERHLQTLSPNKGDHLAGLTMLAQAYHKLDRHRDILTLFETHQPPSSANGTAGTEMMFWRAVAHHHLENHDHVLALTESLGIHEPDSEWMPEILKLRAAALTASGAIEDALAIHEQIADTYPDAPFRDAHRLAWAKTLLLDGQTAAASEILGVLAADRSRPVGREAAYWLGRLAIRENRLDDAHEWFDKLLDHPQITRREAGRYGMAKAEALERQHEIESALAALEDALRLLPHGEDRRQANIDSARLMFETGRADEAAQRLRTIIRDDPARADVADLQMSLANGLLTNEAHATAADEFQVYLEAFTNRIGQAEAMLGLGWALLALDRPAEAAEQFERAARRFDSAERGSEALFKAADAWFAQERYAAALDRYRNAAELAAETGNTNRLAHARYLAAESMIRLEHYEEAITALNELSESFAGHPFAAKALLRIAKLHEERENLREALAVYEMLPLRVSDPAVHADSLLSSGILLYKLFRFDEALEKFNGLLEHVPDHPFAERARFMRVWSYSMTGREEEAMNAAYRFLEQHPESERAPEIRFRIAEHMFNHDHLADAQEHFLELAEQYPENAVADKSLLWAGRTAMRRQNFTEAIEIFGRLAVAYPDSPRLDEARFSQADAFSALGEYADAMVLFDEVIHRSPESYLRPAALGRKGDCQFMLGNREPQRYRDAIDSYRALLETDTAAPDMKLQALYKIGRCHEHLDHKDRALEYFHAAVLRYREIQHQGIRPTPAAVWGFQRAAFDAAAVLESRRQWRQAVNMLQHVADADVPAAAQAATRIERLRNEHWMLMY